jgi:hypothetical protein
MEPENVVMRKALDVPNGTLDFYCVDSFNCGTSLQYPEWVPYRGEFIVVPYGAVLHYTAGTQVIYHFKSIRGQSSDDDYQF